MNTMINIAATAILLASSAPAWAGEAKTADVLTWNRIALEAIERAKPSQHAGFRMMTYTSLAQHAVVSQGGSDAAVATATMRVVGELLPSQAGFMDERLKQAGLAIDERGERAARRLLDEAKEDGFTRAWTGQAPQGDGIWRSLANPPAAPALPAVGGMRTFLIDSGSVFRSEPPPAMDSKRFRDDLAEVVRYIAQPTAETTRIAKFYDMTTGTMVAGFWNERAAEVIGKSGMSALQATTALSTVNAAMIDAAAASHDTKYTYWVPRPAQADPSIKTLIGTPNHPSYPSNHAAISTAAGLVLAHFFPAERERMAKISAEAGMSRIYAGIHYRFDMDAGDEIGRKIAAVAIARHADMLAKRTQRLAAN